MQNLLHNTNHPLPNDYSSPGERVRHFGSGRKPESPAGRTVWTLFITAFFFFYNHPLCSASRAASIRL